MSTPSFASAHRPAQSSRSGAINYMESDDKGGMDLRATSLDRTPQAAAPDGNAPVGRDEIMAALRLARPTYPEAKLKVMYGLVDAANVGFASRSQLQLVLAALDKHSAAVQRESDPPGEVARGAVAISDSGAGHDLKLGTFAEEEEEEESNSSSQVESNQAISPNTSQEVTQNLSLARSSDSNSPTRAFDPLFGDSVGNDATSDFTRLSPLAHAVPVAYEDVQVAVPSPVRPGRSFGTISSANNGSPHIKSDPPGDHKQASTQPLSPQHKSVGRRKGKRRLPSAPEAAANQLARSDADNSTAREVEERPSEAHNEDTSPSSPWSSPPPSPDKVQSEDELMHPTPGLFSPFDVSTLSPINVSPAVDQQHPQAFNEKASTANFAKTTPLVGVASALIMEVSLDGLSLAEAGKLAWARMRAWGGVHGEAKLAALLQQHASEAEPSSSSMALYPEGLCAALHALKVLGATPAHATSMVGVMGAGADAVAFGGPSGLNPNWLASRACALLPVSKNDEDLNSLSSPKLHHSSSSSSSSPGNSSSSSSSTSRGHSLHRRGATRASSTGGNLASRAATESVVEASASPNSPSSSSSSSSLKPFRVNGGRAASLDAVQVARAALEAESAELQRFWQLREEAAALGLHVADASLTHDLEGEVHELQSELVQEARILETSAARLTLAHTLRTQGSPSPSRQLRGPSLEAAPRRTPHHNNDDSAVAAGDGVPTAVVDDRAAEKGEEVSANVSRDSSHDHATNSTTDSPVNDIGWPLPKSSALSPSPAGSSTTVMPPAASRSSRFGAKGAAPRSLGRVFEDDKNDDVTLKAVPAAEAKEGAARIPSSHRGGQGKNEGSDDKDEALATAEDRPEVVESSPLSPLGGLKLAAGATARGGAGASPAWARVRHSLKSVPPRSRTPTGASKGKKSSSSENRPNGNDNNGKISGTTNSGNNRNDKNINSSGNGDAVTTSADTANHHKKEIKGLQSSLAAAQETLAQARANAAVLVAKHHKLEDSAASESTASSDPPSAPLSALSAATHVDAKMEKKAPVVQFDVTLAEHSIESATAELRATFAVATATCLGVSHDQVGVGAARAGSVVLPTSVHLQGASDPNTAAAIVAKAADPTRLAASLSKAGLGSATVSTPTIHHDGIDDDDDGGGTQDEASSRRDVSSTTNANDVEKLRAALQRAESAAKAHEADAIAAERKASNARAEAAAAKSAAALAAAQRSSDEKRDRQALAQASEAVNAATHSTQSLKAELGAAVIKAAEAEAAAEAAAQKGASEHARALGVGAELAVAKATLTKFRNDLAQAKARNDEARDAFREAQRSIQVAESGRAAAEEAASSLEARAAAAAAAHMDAMRHANQESDALRSNLSEKEAKVRELEQEAAASTQHVKNLQESLTALRSGANAAESRVLQLQQELDSAQATASSAEAEVESLKEALSSSEQQRWLSEEKCLEAKADAASRLSEAEDLQRKLRGTQQALSTAQDELTSVKTAAEATQQELQLARENALAAEETASWAEQTAAEAKSSALAQAEAHQEEATRLRVALETAKQDANDALHKVAIAEDEARMVQTSAADAARIAEQEQEQLYQRCADAEAQANSLQDALTTAEKSAAALHTSAVDREKRLVSELVAAAAARKDSETKHADEKTSAELRFTNAESAWKARLGAASQAAVQAAVAAADAKAQVAVEHQEMLREVEAKNAEACAELESKVASATRQARAAEEAAQVAAEASAQHAAERIAALSAEHAEELASAQAKVNRLEQEKAEAAVAAKATLAQAIQDLEDARRSARADQELADQNAQAANQRLQDVETEAAARAASLSAELQRETFLVARERCHVQELEAQVAHLHHRLEHAHAAVAAAQAATLRRDQDFNEALEQADASQSMNADALAALSAAVQDRTWLLTEQQRLEAELQQVRDDAIREATFAQAAAEEEKRRSEAAAAEAATLAAQQVSTGELEACRAQAESVAQQLRLDLEAARQEVARLRESGLADRAVAWWRGTEPHLDTTTTSSDSDKNNNSSSADNLASGGSEPLVGTASSSSAAVDTEETAAAAAAAAEQVAVLEKKLADVEVQWAEEVGELEVRHSLELALAVELAKKTANQSFNVERREEAATINNDTFDEGSRSSGNAASSSSSHAVDLAAMGGGRGASWNSFHPKGGSPRSSSASSSSHGSNPSSPSSAQRRRARRPLPPAASGGRNGASLSRGASSSSSAVVAPPANSPSSHTQVDEVLKSAALFEARALGTDNSSSISRDISSDLQRELLLRQLQINKQQNSGTAAAAEPSPLSSDMATPTAAGIAHDRESVESPLLTLAKRSLAKRPRTAAVGGESNNTQNPVPTPLEQVEPSFARSFVDDAHVAKPSSSTLGVVGPLLRWLVVLCLSAVLCCCAAVMLGLVLGGPLKFTAVMQRSRLQPKPLSPLAERQPSSSSTVLLAAGEWVPSPFRTSLLLGHDGALRVLKGYPGDEDCYAVWSSPVHVPSGRAVNVVAKRNASALVMRAPRPIEHTAPTSDDDMNVNNHGIVDAAAVAAAEVAAAKAIDAVNHQGSGAAKRRVTLEPLYRVQRVALGGGKGGALAVVFAPGLFGSRPEQVWVSPPLNASQPGWGLPHALQPWAVPLPREDAFKAMYPNVGPVAHSALLGALFWSQDDSVIADLPFWVHDAVFTVASALHITDRFLGGSSHTPSEASQFSPPLFDESIADSASDVVGTPPRRGLIPRLLARKKGEAALIPEGKPTDASQAAFTATAAAALETVTASTDASSADAAMPASTTSEAVNAQTVPTAPMHTEGYRALLRRLGSAYFLPSSEEKFAEQRKKLLKEVLPQAIGEQFRARRLLAAEAKSGKAASNAQPADVDEAVGPVASDENDSAPEVAEVPVNPVPIAKPRRRLREYERIRAPVMQP